MIISINTIKFINTKIRPGGSLNEKVYRNDKRRVTAGKDST